MGPLGGSSEGQSPRSSASSMHHVFHPSVKVTSGYATSPSGLQLVKTSDIVAPLSRPAVDFSKVKPSEKSAP